MTEQSSEGVGQQQFVVEQGGRIYLAQVVQEIGRDDPRAQSALSGSQESGTAYSVSGGMEFKSADFGSSDSMLAGGQSASFSGAQTNPPNMDG